MLSAFCKNRDCGDNSAVQLYSAPKGALYGTVYERGNSTLIGNLPPASRPSCRVVEERVALSALIRHAHCAPYAIACGSS